MKTLIVILVLLAGCSIQPRKPLLKEGITQEQSARDEMGCRQYGMQSAMANGMQNNLFVEAWIERESNNCLQMLGYSR